MLYLIECSKCVFLGYLFGFKKTHYESAMRSKNYLVIHMFRITFILCFPVCRLISQVAVIFVILKSQFRSCADELFLELALVSFGNHAP